MGAENNRPACFLGEERQQMFPLGFLLQLGAPAKGRTDCSLWDWSVGI